VQRCRSSIDVILKICWQGFNPQPWLLLLSCYVDLDLPMLLLQVQILQLRLRGKNLLVLVILRELLVVRRAAAFAANLLCRLLLLPRVALVRQQRVQPCTEDRLLAVPVTAASRQLRFKGSSSGGCVCRVKLGPR
jgi:hypothetical protein